LADEAREFLKITPSRLALNTLKFWTQFDINVLNYTPWLMKKGRNERHLEKMSMYT